MRLLCVLPALFLSVLPIANAQQCILSGTVRDAATSKPLQFAHIWVKSISAGTTTDNNGKFMLSLPQGGKYSIRASYMGYKSKTVTVTLDSSEHKHTFRLQPNTIEFPEIVVVPGENPAIPIIRKAIAARIAARERLENYSVEAHTKFTMHFTDIPGDEKEKAMMDSLFFPFETVTTAYRNNQGKRKEIIEGRRQGKMFKDLNNTIGSNGALSDFSGERITNLGIPGPISEDGLDTYWYDLLGKTTYDTTTVYHIRVTPRSNFAPRIVGDYYIADSSYLVVMVNVLFNKVSMPPVFDSVRFKQQFTEVQGFWFPVNGSLSGAITMQSIITIGVDFNIQSVLKNYTVNDPAIENVFDDYVLEVLPTADDIDSVFWDKRALIPLTDMEMHTYQVTDSVAEIQIEEAQTYHPWDVLGTKVLEFDDMQISVPGLFTMYRFNRIQGQGFHVPASAKNLTSSLKEVWFDIGYGWGNEKADWALGGTYWLYKRTNIAADIKLYNRLSYIDRDHFVLPDEDMTAFYLFNEYDPRDFFYEAGGEAGISGYALSFLHAHIHGEYNHYTSASVSTTRTMFGNTTEYPPNPEINDGYITRGALDLILDFRSRILMKGVEQRTGKRHMHFPTAGIEYNHIALEDATWDCMILSAGLRGEFNLGGFGNLQYQMNGRYATSELPTQRLLNLDGSENSFTTPWRFRTMTFREFGGDRIATAFAEWNLGNIIYRTTGLPDIPIVSLKTWELIFFGGAGWSDMSNNTRDWLLFDTKAARIPYYELGFGIDNLLGLFRVDLGWRMNHFREGQNFSVGLSLKTDNFIE